MPFRPLGGSMADLTPAPLSRTRRRCRPLVSAGLNQDNPLRRWVNGIMMHDLSRLKQEREASEMKTAAPRGCISSSRPTLLVPSILVLSTRPGHALPFSVFPTKIYDTPRRD